MAWEESEAKKIGTFGRICVAQANAFAVYCSISFSGRSATPYRALNKIYFIGGKNNGPLSLPYTVVATSFVFESDDDHLQKSFLLLDFRPMKSCLILHSTLPPINRPISRINIR